MFFPRMQLLHSIEEELNLPRLGYHFKAVFLVIKSQLPKKLKKMYFETTCVNHSNA